MENIALLLAFLVFLMCVVLFNTYLILRSQKKIYKHLTQEHTYSTADDVQGQMNERRKRIAPRD